MIYKFKFEVWNDENTEMSTWQSEESGRFWWAFTTFMQYIMKYADNHGLNRREQ
jgi:hypothetical protein